MTTVNKLDSIKIPAIQSDISAEVLTLTFQNGGEIILDAAALTPQLRIDAMMHGLKQKLVDAAAIGRNPDTGRSATIADKFDAVNDVYTRLAGGGDWNKAREGGSGANNGVLVRALVEMTGKSPQTIVTFLEAKTKEEKAALRINPKVAAIIARMQSEKNTAIDTDELLAEIA
jgi:hypothetical protein